MASQLQDLLKRERSPVDATTYQVGPDDRLTKEHALDELFGQQDGYARLFACLLQALYGWISKFQIQSAWDNWWRAGLAH